MKSVVVLAVGLLAGLLIAWHLITNRERLEDLPQPGVEGVTVPVRVKQVETEPEPELIDLRSVLQQLPDDELLLTYPNDAYQTLLSRLEMDEVLGTKEDMEQTKLLLDTVYDHLQKLKADPFYRTRCTVERNLATHPILKDFRVTSAGNAPWVVHVLSRRYDGNPLADRMLAERAVSELARLPASPEHLIGDHPGAGHPSGQSI